VSRRDRRCAPPQEALRGETLTLLRHDPGFVAPNPTYTPIAHGELVYYRRQAGVFARTPPAKAPASYWRSFPCHEEGRHFFRRDVGTPPERNRRRLAPAAKKTTRR